VAWLSGFGVLTAIIPGQPPMMPNTALSLLLLGVAGALGAPENAGRSAKAVSVIVALVVLAVAVATLAESLLASDLGVDHALTTSCYDPLTTPDGWLACGHCDSCLLRRKGFADVGRRDPIAYATGAGESATGSGPSPGGDPS
jgi:hypothetical protein